MCGSTCAVEYQVLQNKPVCSVLFRRPSKYLPGYLITVKPSHLTALNYHPPMLSSGRSCVLRINNRLIPRLGSASTTRRLKARSARLCSTSDRRRLASQRATKFLPSLCWRGRKACREAPFYPGVRCSPGVVVEVLVAVLLLMHTRQIAEIRDEPQGRVFFLYLYRYNYVSCDYCRAFSRMNNDYYHGTVLSFARCMCYEIVSNASALSLINLKVDTRLWKLRDTLVARFYRHRPTRYNGVDVELTH